MEYYYKYPEEVQVGIDEAGKGCMIGPVYAAAVIWDANIDKGDIKDSKKLSRKKRAVVKEYIEENALDYGVGFATNEEVDEMNILNANYLAMHRALQNLDTEFDRILVDGDRFKPYQCMVHTCIVKGDDKFVNIAAASILAKENHDDWITTNFGDDDKYNLMNNKGYGTKAHLEALREHGLTEYHRKSFCKKFI
jgi:ribonuclease HII